MILNTTYAKARVGTGVYTRNMHAALPEARSMRLPRGLLADNAGSFWTRRAAEAAMTLLPGTVVHPYWAPDVAPGHVISVLDFVQYREATQVERRLLGRAARKSHVIVVLSADVAAQIEWQRPRVIVAPPFPDAPWYATPISPRPLSTGPIKIGYFGGWHPRKGMPAFLDVMARSSLAAEVEILCTGPPPSPAPRGLKVRPCGSLTVVDTVALADRCDLLVYPSAEEGYGLPVIEGLLRERPVVCRDLPVYREFVARPEALHVPTSWEDPGEIARTIEAAVSSEKLGRHDTLVPRASSHDRAVAALRAPLLSAMELLEGPRVP